MGKVIQLNCGLGTQLTKEQAIEIFNRESVLIGEVNVITEKTLYKILGEDCIDFNAMFRSGNDYCSAWGFKEKYIRYCYLKGFLYAVSNHNVMLELGKVVQNDTGKCEQNQSKRVSNKAKQV